MQIKRADNKEKVFYEKNIQQSTVPKGKQKRL